ncbi:MFS transporter [Protaetiibacter mangrovi]|uniref:MFS transporter n=1 Tax=Protaetiibacter mangrovi TaxID=2970926 RepID=A0ABT1ZE94_9MICO|nr:MFS transporter [Protaetiibacter mangrovi]MCS0499029.1 MFS transporter [Protaetiibacter mangrovi]
MSSAPPPPASGDDYPVLTEPIPVFDRRPTLRESFAALAVFNYRLYLGALMLGSTGGWMARVAIDWLVLELTGDVRLVGLAVALQFAPTLLLGAWAGVLSDRLPRRYVLLTTQVVATISNGVLAVLVLSGAVLVWQVLLIAAVTGVAGAIEGPSRSAFVSEMVGTRRLRGAISLNATTFHLGGLLGPAISGVLIAALGSGWSIAINAGTTAIAVLAISLMRGHELVPTPKQPRSRGQIREAMRYAWRKPAIRWTLVLLAAVSVFGMNLPVLLAAAADDTYGTGATGYGLYNSLCAGGAFLGAILSSRRRSLRLRDVVGFALLYGGITMLAGWDGWYPVFLSALVGIGVSRLLFAMSAEALTQLSTNPAIRGRVVSFYIMVLMGGQAAGGVVMGAIAEAFGGRVAFLVAGAVPVLVAAIVGLVLARRHQLRIRVDLRRPRRLLTIVRA